MTQNMWNVFILLGGIVLVVSIIGTLDLIGRRQQRRKAGKS
jgi:hypothetical protein